MIIVYGADWCEDTRRSLRHLRRLGVRHTFLNVDEDLDALARATALNGGERRTPTVDLGVGGAPLIEPANDTLTEALVELEMLTTEDARERLHRPERRRPRTRRPHGCGCGADPGGVSCAETRAMAASTRGRIAGVVGHLRVEPGVSRRRVDFDRRTR